MLIKFDFEEDSNKIENIVCQIKRVHYFGQRLSPEINAVIYQDRTGNWRETKFNFDQAFGIYLGSNLVAVFSLKEAEMAKAKFSVGQKVNHAASPRSPAGTGTVEKVVNTNVDDVYVYKVRCDATNEVLPDDFKEADLSPA